MKVLKLTLLLLLVQTAIYAQNIALKENVLDTKGKIYFTKPANKLSSSLQNESDMLRSILQSENQIEFKLVRTATVNERAHNYYQFTLKGIPIIGADYVVHSKNGEISFANGNIPILPKTINEKAKIDFSKAQDILNQNLFAKNKSNKDVSFSYKNKGLVWFYQDENLILAYQIETEGNQPLVKGNYFIDANTSKVLGFESFICNGRDKNVPPPNANAVGQTLYSGTQNFTSDANFNGGFRLREVRNTVNISTLNANNQTNPSTIVTNATDFFDNDNIWQTNEHAVDVQAHDAHWGAERVFDYWITVHNRNSIDNNGIPIRSFIHVGSGYDNAYWASSVNAMFYGDGGSLFRPLTSLDVCAHEFGHGICQFTSNLLYTSGSESSALNEGFSDIWGASIEAWSAPNKQRWLIGEEITLVAPFYLRSMSNPKTGAFVPSADCYASATWNNQSDAHYRSGVINKWFQLLSDGGTATNDLGNTYNVVGITIDNAARIAYLTEQLLNSTANYAMARTMSIQAAIQLYGANSCEEIAVTNAWFAVGVGAAYQSQASISGDDVICSNSAKTYILNGIPCNSTVTWSLTNNSIGATLSTTVGSSTTITTPSTAQIAILTLTATITGIATPITKQIYIGAPFFGATYKNGVTAGNPVAIYFPNQGNNNLFNNVCLGYNGLPNVYIDGQPSGSNNIVWSVPNGYATTAFSLYTGYGNRAYFGWNYGGNTPPGYIQASVSNSCGSYTQIFAFKQVNCGTPGGDPCPQAKGVNYFTISPNPTSDIIKIGIGNKPPPIGCNTLKALTTSNGIVFSIVNVYDNLGILVKTYKTKDAKAATILIGDLIVGSYLVEIRQGDYVEKHQIIIQK